MHVRCVRMLEDRVNEAERVSNLCLHLLARLARNDTDTLSHKLGSEPCQKLASRRSGDAPTE